MSRYALEPLTRCARCPSSPRHFYLESGTKPRGWDVEFDKNPKRTALLSDLPALRPEDDDLPHHTSSGQGAGRHCFAHMNAFAAKRSTGRNARSTTPTVFGFEQTSSGIIGNDWAMRIGYRFVIYSGDNVEILGTMALGDDDQARLFGAEVIHDLMENAPTRYAAYTMDIVHGERTVASIPFAPAG